MLHAGVMRGADNGTFTYKINSDNAGITITGLVDGCTETDLDIPEKIEELPVVTIGNSAFKNNSQITSVKIPASVTLIGLWAFLQCENLTSATLAEGSLLTTIDRDAFDECSKLTSINVSDAKQLKTIGLYAFYGTILSNVIIPASVEQIGDDAFHSCHELTSVTLAEGSQLTDIGDNAFDNCSKLTSINTSNAKQLKTIGDGAFMNTGLTSIEIPASVETLGKSALYIKNLTSVTFAQGSNLKTIGNGAFGSSNLQSITIPSTVESIGNDAFYLCFSLTSVTLEDGSQLKAIGNNAFRSCKNLTSINTSKAKELSSIGNNAFLSCSSLDNFEIPTAVKTIGEDAFGSCKFQSITIPSTVESIGNEAFNQCSDLTTVTFDRIAISGRIANYQNSIFTGCTSLATINVPYGCESQYKSQLGVADNITIQEAANITDNILTFKPNEANDGLACTGFLGDAQETVTIPETVQDCPVNVIAQNAFENVRYIKVAGDKYDTFKSQSFNGNDKLVTEVVTDENQTVTLSDNEGFSSKAATFYAAGKLNYQRTVDSEGEYATLCLPYDIDLSKTNGAFEKVFIPMNMMIRNTKESDSKNDTFILVLKKQSLTSTIPANTPMFVKLAAENKDISLTSTTDMILNSTDKPVTVNMTVVDWDGTTGLMEENSDYNISYSSSYQPVKKSEQQGNLWAFNENGTFGPLQNETLNPFRLFLLVNNSGANQAKTYSISIGVGDDSTTGISEIISAGTKTAESSAHTGIIYDLNGRKVSDNANNIKNLHKGIYILNGKKFVVK